MTYSRSRDKHTFAALDAITREARLARAICEAEHAELMAAIRVGQPAQPLSKSAVRQIKRTLHTPPARA